MAEAGFQRPPTAQEAVLEELRRSIASGAWTPGSPIRQDAVATELGVSRVPVREALKILEGEGQVEYRPHRGYLVAELDLSELEDIYRVRELLEAEAVRHGIPRLTTLDLEEMREAMLVMRKLPSADVGSLTAENRRFHFALFEAAAKPRLQHFIRVLWDFSEPYRAMFSMDPDNLALAFEEHQAVFDASEARDEQRVIDLLQAHRIASIEAVRRMMAARVDAEGDGRSSAAAS